MIKEVLLLKGFSNGQTTFFQPVVVPVCWESRGMCQGVKEETSASTWICIYSFIPFFSIEMKYSSAEQLEKIHQPSPAPCRGDTPWISHVESFPTGIVFFPRAIACSSYPRAFPLILLPKWPARHLPVLLSQPLYSHCGAGIYIWHMFLLFPCSSTDTPALFPCSLKGKGIFFRLCLNFASVATFWMLLAEQSLQLFILQVLSACSSSNFWDATSQAKVILLFSKVYSKVK